mmetsp:Transcript_53720/g.166814  ORF Transcript_53720/g.166814 Transcript_53720/m.166814 type:complete len:286 (+) Transcript_53720:1292-2149(+)
MHRLAADPVGSGRWAGAGRAEVPSPVLRGRAAKQPAPPRLSLQRRDARAEVRSLQPPHARAEVAHGVSELRGEIRLQQVEAGLGGGEAHCELADARGDLGVPPSGAASAAVHRVLGEQRQVRELVREAPLRALDRVCRGSGNILGQPASTRQSTAALAPLVGQPMGELLDVGLKCLETRLHQHHLSRSLAAAQHCGALLPRLRHRHRVRRKLRRQVLPRLVRAQIPAQLGDCRLHGEHLGTGPVNLCAQRHKPCRMLRGRSRPVEGGRLIQGDLFRIQARAGLAS